MTERNRLHARNHALMFNVFAHQPRQTSGFNLRKVDLAGFSLRDQITRTRIAAGEVEIDLQYASRVVAQARQHGMKTINELFCSVFFGGLLAHFFLLPVLALPDFFSARNTPPQRLPQTRSSRPAQNRSCWFRYQRASP